METSTRDLLGREAPDGDLAIEFLHTKFGSVDGPPGGPMPLNEYDDLLGWGRRFETIGADDERRLRRTARVDPDASRAAFERAIEFRTALDSVLRSLIDGDRPSPTALAILRTNETDGLAAARLVPRDGRFDWTWGSEAGLRRPLWPVVHDAIELMTAGPLDRVKACDRCQYLFIDRSKNRSRRWCSMAACGTAVKMQRYVARRAAKRGTAADPAP
jgi:predicted RNA-binding Zn ribbon-like protein